MFFVKTDFTVNVVADDMKDIKLTVILSKTVMLRIYSLRCCKERSIVHWLSITLGLELDTICLVLHARDPGSNPDQCTLNPRYLGSDAKCRSQAKANEVSRDRKGI